MALFSTTGEVRNLKDAFMIMPHTSSRSEYYSHQVYICMYEDLSRNWSRYIWWWTPCPPGSDHTGLSAETKLKFSNSAQFLRGPLSLRGDETHTTSCRVTSYTPYVCTCIYVCTMYVCGHVCVYVIVYVCMYVCVYVWVCVYVSILGVCACIYIMYTMHVSMYLYM